MRKLMLLIPLLCGGLSYAEEDAALPLRPELASTAEEREKARGLHNESSLGFTLNGGNSDAQNLNLRQRTGYGWDQNRLQFTGHYLFGRAGGADAANNWSAEPRYERYFSPSFGAFVANRWEGNRFAGIDYRANGDVGGRLYLLGDQGDTTYVVNETGYRYQYESRIPGQNPQLLRNHFARIYFEGKTVLTQGIWLKAWVELLPNFTRSQDYLINFEPSVGVMLSDVISLQLSFFGQYDGFPAQGKKPFDFIYSTSLVANY